MARLKSTYSTYVAAQEKKGAVTSLSHEATVRIDTRISKAFSSAQKTATVKAIEFCKTYETERIERLDRQCEFLKRKRRKVYLFLRVSHLK